MTLCAAVVEVDWGITGCVETVIWRKDDDYR